ncbi:MAG: hypothetical protein ACOWWO_12765 [Peptococcaceae bacterium]
MNKSGLTIGIAGTAKNTGKTTTTTALMEQIKNNNLKLGLTSIGYDGEDLDNVTGLPKPKIEVWPGVLVAVAERCLDVSSALIDVLEVTNLRTPLGKIILGKVIQSGRLVIAGPNKSSELKQILSKLRRHNLDFIIVDGALNRIAPMVEAEGLVLTTGAARKDRIKDLAFETHCIVEILNYPVANPASELLLPSILDTRGAEFMLNEAPKAGIIEIRGLIVEKALSYLVQRAEELKDKMVIFPDPIKLLISGDVNRVHNLLNQFKKAGVNIGVRKQIKIIAVTVNPYFPKYRFNHDDYEAAYIDKEELQEEIALNVPVPVYNIVEEGGERLLQSITKSDSGS